MLLTVLKFITGPIQTNTYLVYNENKKSFIVDPSSGCDKLIELIKKESFDVESIVITHAHFDHIMGIPEILNISPNAAIYVNPLEKAMLQNAELNSSVLIGEDFTYQGNTIDLVEGEIAIGSFDVKVFEVPGTLPVELLCTSKNIFSVEMCFLPVLLAELILLVVTRGN